MKHLYLIIMMLLVLSACNSETAKHRRVYDALIGKQISIPSDLYAQILEDSIGVDDYYDFRIITLVDSAGCTPCKMQLQAWNDFMTEVMKNTDVDVSFRMIIESESNSDLIHNLESYDFLYPVVFDGNSRFRERNPIPEERIYHTLLLDSEQKVIAIGNPVTNPKIRELFLKFINGEGKPCEEYYPDIIMTSAVGIVEKGDTITQTFRIDNPTDSILTVMDFSTTCECLSALVVNDTLKPRKSVDVKMTWRADSTIGSFRQYADIYFNEPKIRN